jgi:hypothetical protein
MHMTFWRIWVSFHWNQSPEHHLWLALMVKVSSTFVVSPFANFCWQLDFFLAPFV